MHSWAPPAGWASGWTWSPPQRWRPGCCWAWPSGTGSAPQFWRWHWRMCCRWAGVLFGGLVV